MNLRSLFSVAAVVASLAVPAIANAQKVPNAAPVQPRTVYVHASGPAAHSERASEEARRAEAQRQIEARRVAEQRRIEEARRAEQRRLEAQRHAHTPALVAAAPRALSHDGIVRR